MGTLTTNYLFQKPTPGGDPDTWGDDYAGGDPLIDPSPGLNGNWEKTDQLIKAQSDIIDQLQLDLTQLQTDLEDVRTQTQIQIGELYHSTTDTDPATTLGYGTWEAYAAGRALVGVGTSDTADAKVWAAEETSGLESHTLIPEELPNPTTYFDINQSNRDAIFYIRKRGDGGDISNGGTNVSQSNDGGSSEYAAVGKDGNGNRRKLTINLDHNHSHGSVTAENDLPHNNIQPSIAVYIWKRLT